ncbi:unnamed protein product [Fusarium fujikuroi]|uniref:Uncharacterized protein n=1 Tax=Fusarium fujikuroi TaxID=5127 RepID=A0A9Q9RSK8_FUSFU|nr:uncharacterized protein FFE2_04886 [Fusarium fujikuroi]SCV35366.1 uncharacterized protein FFFS_04702 [Fusarium fujikuroi]VTT63508.1 unnamed protein product [Fusarium fujikuroi]VTT73810.1 unnamed protein product [Fusarium fujikuroi]VZI04248.1 unnamed protein product [Fusarium fujikuroi]
MESALETLRALQANPQNLSASDRNLFLAQCRVAIVQIEASEVFESVQNAHSAGFQFHSSSLRRLTSILNGFTKESNDRIGTFQDLDPELVIICGLCISVKDVNRMKAETWSEVARQARLTAKRLAPYLARSTQIEGAVNKSSNNNFKTKFESFQRDFGVLRQIKRIIVNGVYCYHYIAPCVPQLEHLSRLADTGMVALYVPDIESDGRLRITTQWDENLLNGLFGCQLDVYEATGLIAYAYRDRVTQYLGGYISEAIETSQTRASDLPENPITQSVSCNGFPGQVIIVDVYVGKRKCIEILGLAL